MQLAPRASLWAAFSAPEDGTNTAFSGVFNQLAAMMGGAKRFAHCALLWKVDDDQKVGFHSSIVWGGKVFCEPCEFTVEESAADGKGTVIVPRYGKMHTIRICVPLDWSPVDMMATVDSFQGMCYDKAGAVLSAAPNWASRQRQTTADNKATFCSEYCSFLLHKHAGVSLQSMQPSQLCPNELYSLLTQ